MEHMKRVNSTRNNKGTSYFLLLMHIRAVLEKHGGVMRVDENPYTIVLSIPHDRKEACYGELEGMLDAIKRFIRIVTFTPPLNPPMGANTTRPYKARCL